MTRWGQREFFRRIAGLAMLIPGLTLIGHGRRVAIADDGYDNEIIALLRPLARRGVTLAAPGKKILSQLDKA